MGFAFLVFHFMKNCNEDLLLLTSKYHRSVTRCVTPTTERATSKAKVWETHQSNHTVKTIPTKPHKFLSIILENQVTLILEHMEDAEFTALIF